MQDTNIRPQKWFIFSLLIVGVLSFAIPIVFADDAAENSNEQPAIQESFNVDEYLRIGGKKEEKADKGATQGQEYFKEAEKLSVQTGQPVSPVAAFIVDVINFLIAIIGVVSLLVFILGALLTVLSEGKEDRLTKGKDAMLYAIIGLVIALGSYLIATFVQSIFF